MDNEKLTNNQNIKKWGNLKNRV